MTNQDPSLVFKMANTVIGYGDSLELLFEHLKPIKQELKKYNPPRDVVNFTEDGFDINMENMDAGRCYIFKFKDSRYLIRINDKDELVVDEIG